MKEKTSNNLKNLVIIVAFIALTLGMCSTVKKLIKEPSTGSKRVERTVNNTPKKSDNQAQQTKTEPHTDQGVIPQYNEDPGSFDRHVCLSNITELREAGQEVPDTFEFVEDCFKKEFESRKVFEKSPFLHQKYDGYIDKYVKVAINLTPEEYKTALKAIAAVDKKYFTDLCKNSPYTPNLVYDQEIKDREVHLVHNKDSHILCGDKNTNHVKVFKFNPEHCDPDKPAYRAHQFGEGIVYTCHKDRYFDKNIKTLIQLLDKKTTSSLNKAKDEKAAIVQDKLKVQGR